MVLSASLNRTSAFPGPIQHHRGIVETFLLSFGCPGLPIVRGCVSTQSLMVTTAGLDFQSLFALLDNLEGLAEPIHGLPTNVSEVIGVLMRPCDPATTQIRHHIIAHVTLLQVLYTRQ